MRGGEISTIAKLHPSGRWITVNVVVAGTRTLSMVLDTGAPVSALSPHTGTILEARGLASPSSDPRVRVLRNLTIAGHSVPDLEVRLLARLDRIQVVGLLGLDFLRLFEDVHFNVPSLRLRLVR